jgi:predicted tellurium resistance membrane protein TerC
MTSQEIFDGLAVIASLVLIEGLLSVDNVLGIAALARGLPPDDQKKAIRLGMAGAYLFRVLALLAATWLISNTWVRWLGAGYLIYLMASHLCEEHAVEEADGTAGSGDAGVPGKAAISKAGLAWAWESVLYCLPLALTGPEGSRLGCPGLAYQGSANSY